MTVETYNEDAAWEKLMSGDFPHCIAEDKVGLARAFSGVDPAPFPVLATAIRRIETAYNPKVEWNFGSDTGVDATFNYTEIFRTPYGPLEERSALLAHFAQIEEACLNGKIEITPTTRRMGGVREILGRDLDPSDAVYLSLLREVGELTRKTLSNGMNEWRSELTIVAYAIP